MSNDRTCLVLDRHALVRVGVRGLLHGQYEVEEAADWREAKQLIASAGGFDVVVVELGGAATANGDPTGVGLIKAVRKAMPGAGIVALAHMAERHAANKALAAGAAAYVVQSSPAEALATAIDAAAESERFIDPAARANGTSSPLTPRQHEILQLLADGISTTQIAHRLRLSAETVRTHTKAMLARLSAKDRAHAVAIALRSGLIH